MATETTRIYSVSGMTCGHCQSSVEQEVGGLESVSSAVVDLEAGTVTVTGTADESDVKAAVEEAGYEVTAAR